MNFKKKYFFETWNEWNDIITRSSEDFYSQYGYYPNILEANSHTFSQVDFICNVNKQHGENVYKVDELTGEKEFLLHVGKNVKVNIFKSGNYEIEFALDDKLKDREFVLFYEDEPEWYDDNDVPIESNPFELII